MLRLLDEARYLFLIVSFSDTQTVLDRTQRNRVIMAGEARRLQIRDLGSRIGSMQYSLKNIF